MDDESVDWAVAFGSVGDSVGVLELIEQSIRTERCRLEIRSACYFQEWLSGQHSLLC